MSNQQVKIAIQNGEFYKDAKEWYLSRFVQPLSLRAQVMLLSILILMATAISVYTIQRSFVSTAIPFAIWAKDQVTLYPRLQKLASRTEPLEISVARYFVSKYVELRESYNYLDFLDENKEAYLVKLQALSSRRSFKEYMEFMNPDDNPESPIVLYKNQIRRSIDIKSVSFNKVEGYLDSATIIFQATEKSKDSVHESTYRAEVRFSISNIEKVASKKERLMFFVTSYQIYKL